MTTPAASLRVAVVGAGPAGLALALQAARALPVAEVCLFDARPLERDLSGDSRTLALSIGSVQLFERLQAWPAAAAAPILKVHVSQATPTAGLQARPVVTIEAAALGVPMLGAVLGYGALVGALQQAWLESAALSPQRLHNRFGQPVAGLKAVPGGVEIDAGVCERFDLAVVAEGGVFAEQARKALRHDYRQTAWVGQVTLQRADAGAAFERFTRQGPLALLPMRPLPAQAAGTQRAALVWCVDADDDPLAPLGDEQRIAVVNTLLPAEAGRVVAMSALKSFALGLNAERSLVGGSNGRIVRIGNAAQTLHPVAGQGLNLGLRDAFALVQALRFAGDVDGALRRVEWARAPDRWSMIAATDFLARSFTWQFPGVATARGLGLVALQALPGLKSALARQMMFGRR